MPVPFLARVPTKYLNDPLEREFWDYFMRYLRSLVRFIEQELGTIPVDVFATSFAVAAEELPSQNAVSSSDVFRAFTVPSNNFELVDRDFALVNNGYMVYLPANPAENTIIKVANGDGLTVTVQGNGRLISGLASQSFSTATMVLDFYYFIDADTWMIA